MTLTVNRIETFYGRSQALFGLSMQARAGAATALIGRNGMGKTTTVASITGIRTCRRGEIFYRGEKINDLPAYNIAQRGIGLVPEGRQIFPNLNVRENLVATAANYNRSDAPWTLERVLELFPQLKNRLNNMGNQLSGGEQQMLATGRALLLNPSLLILDEATEGLAPLVQRDFWRKLHEIKATGVALLIIDKNLNALCDLADHHYIIEKGVIAWHGDSAQLRADPELQTRYLGV